MYGRPSDIKLLNLEMNPSEYFDHPKCNITDEANCNASSANGRHSDAMTAPSDLRSSSAELNKVGNIGGCNRSELTSRMRKISKILFVSSFVRDKSLDK